MFVPSVGFVGECYDKKVYYIYIADINVSTANRV
jgi:hypothetical protein